MSEHAFISACTRKVSLTAPVASTGGTSINRSTTMAYDALNRVISETIPNVTGGGSVVNTTVYNGLSVTSSKANGWRRGRNANHQSHHRQSG